MEYVKMRSEFASILNIHLGQITLANSCFKLTGSNVYETYYMSFQVG